MMNQFNPNLFQRYRNWACGFFLTLATLIDRWFGRKKAIKLNGFSVDINSDFNKVKDLNLPLPITNSFESRIQRQILIGKLIPNLGLLQLNLNNFTLNRINIRQS